MPPADFVAAAIVHPPPKKEEAAIAIARSYGLSLPRGAADVSEPRRIDAGSGDDRHDDGAGEASNSSWPSDTSESERAVQPSPEAQPLEVEAAATGDEGAEEGEEEDGEELKELEEGEVGEEEEWGEEEGEEEEQAYLHSFCPRVSAHDMLLRDGAEALLFHVRHKASYWPMTGLFKFSSFAHEVWELYEMVR